SSHKAERSIPITAPICGLIGSTSMVGPQNGLLLRREYASSQSALPSLSVWKSCRPPFTTDAVKQGGCHGHRGLDRHRTCRRGAALWSRHLQSVGAAAGTRPRRL